MKKALWILATGLFLLALTACAQTSSIPSTISTTKSPSLLQGSDLESTWIEWYGRTVQIDEFHYFYHTATGFKVVFFGRSILIDFRLEDKHQDIYYSMAKDGADLLEGDVFVQREPNERLSVEFDTFGEHSLEVVKRSEPEDGVTAVVSMQTNGYFMPAQPVDRPHFLILGASGISGHGALGSEGQERSTANSSSLHSFGYLTARAFDGSFEFVAQSGWGLLYGFNDPTGNVNIAKAYDYVGIDADQDIVDIPYVSGQKPDYAIINLGGNDFSAVVNRRTGFERTAAVQAFQNAVAVLIRRLRADAPDGHIFWTVTAGSQNGAAAADVIDRLDAADREFVHLVVIKQVGEDGDPIGANDHASVQTHQRSAQILMDLIESLLGS